MKSMTGYGRGIYEADCRSYTVEIKSVNHKYSDITIKLPRNLSFLEDKIRKEVQAKVNRGKIDITVTFLNYSSEGKKIIINKELAQNYLEELNELCKSTGLENKISAMDLVKLPEVLTIENADEEELLWNELKIALQKSLDNFMQAREQEGNRIKEDLQTRINTISRKIKEISEYSSGLVKEYIVKLEERIKELLQTDVIDQTRLAQEVVIFSDKSSIEEELTRLNSHIIQFEKIIQKQEPIGKNLDFLVQEMNRETNTIGSKANKLEITNLVVEIKTIIEDVREQIQNIE